MDRVGRFCLLLVSVVALGGCGSTVAPSASPAPRLDDAASVMQARLDALGITGGRVRIEAGAIAVDGLPDNRREEVLATLRRPGVIEFVAVPADAEAIANGDTVPAAWPRLFGGEAIDRSTPVMGVDQSGLRTINLALNAAGAERLRQWSHDHVGGQFAIVADGKVLTAPVVNEELIGGKVQISSGGASGSGEREDTVLVALLRSGPLPAEFVAAGAPIR
jgi:preprotein translocase subunit SecD